MTIIELLPWNVIFFNHFIKQFMWHFSKTWDVQSVVAKNCDPNENQAYLEKYCKFQNEFVLVILPRNHLYSIITWDNFIIFYLFWGNFSFKSFEVIAIVVIVFWIECQVFLKTTKWIDPKCSATNQAITRLNSTILRIFEVSSETWI